MALGAPHQVEKVLCGRLVQPCAARRLARHIGLDSVLVEEVAWLACRVRVRARPRARARAGVRARVSGAVLVEEVAEGLERVIDERLR